MDWAIRRKGNEVWSRDRGYFHGVMLGDGWYEQHPKCGAPYVMLKACDRDFVEYWADCVERLIGKRYAIGSIRNKSPKHRVAYYCKVYSKELMSEVLEHTEGKKKVPDGILNGPIETKKAFLQGLMDSEAYISMVLSPLKGCNINLVFGATDSWVLNVREMFGEVGILTTPVNRRKHNPTPRYPNPRKDLLYFRIDALDYVDSGMTFNIERKRHRLEYISGILRDFTRDYPKYNDYYERGVDDKVRP